MVQSKSKFRCRVITPEARVLEADVREVVFPAHDGLRGVWPDHAPFLCRMGMGIVSYRDMENGEHRLFVEGGIAHISENELTILASDALTPHQITRADAENSLRQAETMPMGNSYEVQRRSEAIYKARQLIALTQKKSALS